MATTDAERVFIDTNVLVAHTLTEAPGHTEARRALREYAERENPCWISRQVLREFIAVLTRPQTYAAPTPIAVVLERAETFETRFHLAEDGPEVTRRLHALLREFPTGGKQIHDANIVATALSYDIPRILTNNTADFLRFANIIQIIPLQTQGAATR